MGESVAAPQCNQNYWTIVCDDSCPMVQRLAWLVRNWDRNGIFRFVGRDSVDAQAPDLLRQLDSTRWSLLLLDETGESWSGPEAIPFILKNLPSGKLAAVTYTLPGTMWMTRQLYHWVSRNRRVFSQAPQSASQLKSPVGS